MTKLKEKSYTRVTLALDIIRRLTEGPYAGYHELHSIKHRIDLHDVITVEQSETMAITCNHPHVPQDERNVCWKAAALLKKECAVSENVHIIIEKRIPVQGGLAGGSANAATVLALLNTLWQLNLDAPRLCTIGRRVGMDVPYYFTGGTVFDTESTGVLEPIPTDISLAIVLVIPSFGVSTKQAYSIISYDRIARNTDKTCRMRHALLKNDRDAVIALMHNDFEESVFAQYPHLARIKKGLMRAGCLNAVMSGSGSTIVGIAEDRDHAQDIVSGLSVPAIITATCSFL